MATPGTPSRVCPEPPPPDFSDLTPTSIIRETASILEQSAALRDEIVSRVTVQTATFANTIRPLVDDANRAACRLVTFGYLVPSVSPDPSLRDAAREARRMIMTAESKNLMRGDVASLVAAVFRSQPDEGLDAQDRHLINHLHGQHLRSGAEIKDESKRSKLTALTEELHALRVAAQKTIADADGGIWLSHSELDGTPEYILAELSSSDENQALQSTEGDRIWVTFRSAHISKIKSHVPKGSTRRKYQAAHRRQLPENRGRLDRIVLLRDEIARLLGFQNHAALKMEEKMAGSVSEVLSTMEDARRKLAPLAVEEDLRLLQFKKHDPLAEDPDMLHDWDRAYYSTRQKKEKYKIDAAAVAEYFEARHTSRKMLTVFEELFGLEFEDVTASVPLWHPDVMAYTAWDSRDEGGAFLGYLYIDMFGREGKYYQNMHHTAIRRGFVEANGKRHYPASALICSFTPPTASKPALLKHQQVEVLFHELGHCIHNLVSRTKYALLHPRDFGEIPSLMLENWTWNPDVLISLGRHYASVGNPTVGKENGALPRELAEAVCRLRTLNAATTILAAIQRAIFDLAIHGPATAEDAKAMDVTMLWNTTRRDIAGQDDDPQDWGFQQAQFGHIFRAYDAGFYTYATSEITAADLYANAFASDPLNPDTGRKYRYQVLEPGSSLPERETLERFLGRRPNSEAYFRQLADGRALLK